MLWSESRSAMASMRFAVGRESPALCPVETGSHAYQRRALLHGDREILRGAHREAGQPMGVGELLEGREVAPAGLRILGERRHRHQAADPHGSALEEGREVVRGDAGLALLPRHVDLDEDLGLRRAVLPELAQRGVGGDRVDQLGVREDLLDLAALELADEVPAELGVGGRLGLELLGAVLPQQREPGLVEDVEVLERDVLDRREQLDVVSVAAGLARRLGDLGTHALEPAPHGLQLDAADQARHTTPACRPVTPRSRRWEKNSPNQHIEHSPTSWTSSTPAASSCARATFARSRLRSPTRASYASKTSWTTSPTS